MKRPKIGLALGGGGARGISHVGVLKTLEKHNIPIDCIAGASIGAIIGGGYAVTPDAAHLEQTVHRFVESEAYQKSGLQLIALNEPAENFWGQVAKSVRERIVINLAHSKSSVISGWRLKNIIDFVLKDVNIEHTKIPLAIVATDLEYGHDVIFQHGSLRQAALASASIPGFLPPVDYMGYNLVDGAVTCPVPVETAFGMGADLVIAVDVGQSLEKTSKQLNIVDIIFRTNTITGNRLRMHTLAQADIVIRPDVGNLHWADFSDIGELIRAGEIAANDKINAVFDKIHKLLPFWKRLFNGWRAGKKEDVTTERHRSRRVSPKKI